MGVIDGQPVDAATTNPAFIDANQDDQTLAKLGLNDQDPSTVSGPQITNAQRQLNSIASFLGMAINGIKNLLPTWTTSESFLSTDNVFQRADKLSSKFPSATGHSHNPATAGDGGAIDASYVANVRLRAKIQQGINIIGATGVSSDISSQFTLKNPSGNDSTKGVVTNVPYNQVALRQASGASQGDSFFDGSGNLVYGRITYSAGVWTLSFYVLISGTETAYSFGSASDIAFYYQEIFNSLTEGPVYDSSLFIPSENTTADVVDASATQRGLVNTLAQSFQGIKTFLAQLIVSDTTDASSPTTGSIKTAGGLGVAKSLWVGLTATITGVLSVLDTTDSSSTTTGSFTTAGGVGIAKKLYVGLSSFFGGILTVLDTTQSTNKDTGSAVLEGGLGVEKNINAGGNINAVGTVTGSNLSGTNTGDVTATTIGSTPNANGFSLSGQQVQLQPSNASFGGVNTTLDQEYSGEKRFLKGIAFQVGTDSTTTGADQTIDGGSFGVLKLTNASLTSVTLIQRLNDTAKQLMVMNNTGAAIIFKNLNGTETSNVKQIRTGTGLNVTLANGASLLFVYDEVSDKWQLVGAAASSGSSSGVRNFVFNGTAEESPTSPMIPYQDASASRPVDGTGGSPTVTTSITTTAPLDQTASILLTKPSGNLQGQGWAVPFTIDNAYKAKVLNIKVKNIVNSGTFVAGQNFGTPTDSDVIWYLYDITNGVLIEPSSIRMLSNSSTISDEFLSTFQTNSNSTSYRLIAHVATTTTAAFELKVEIEVSPSNYAYGTPISDWFSYTPTVNNVTLGTGGAITGLWRRVGSDMEIQSYLVLGTGGAFTAIAGHTIPSGFTVDTARLISTDKNDVAIGYATGNDNSGGVFFPFVAEWTAARAQIEWSSPTGIGTVNATVPWTWAVNDFIKTRCVVPIVGWGASSQASDSADTRQQFATLTRATTLSIPNNTVTKVQFDSIVEDSHGYWDSTNSRYVMQTSGKLRLSGCFAYAANATGTRATIYRINGGSDIYMWQGGANADSAACPVTGETVQLKAGDYVEFYAFQSSGGSLNLTTFTRVNISKLSGPAAISASEKIAVTARRPVSAQNFTTGVAGDILYTTVDIDTHGLYNTSTGEFTCQRADIYDISAAFVWSTGSAVGFRAVLILKNGSTVAQDRPEPFGSGAQIRARVNTQVRLVAGDKIKIQGLQNSGGTIAASTDGNVPLENILTISSKGGV